MKPPSVTHLSSVALMGFAVPAYVAVGSALALRHHPLDLSKADAPEVQAAALPAGKPLYQAIVDPVVASRASGQTLSLEIAILLDPETPSSLLVVLENGRSVLTADMATAVQEAIAQAPEPFSWADVAAPVKDALRAALNAAFERDGMPPYAQEVLVLKAVHATPNP